MYLQLQVISMAQGEQHVSANLWKICLGINGKLLDLHRYMILTAKLVDLQDLPLTCGFMVGWFTPNFLVWWMPSNTAAFFRLLHTCLVNIPYFGGKKRDQLSWHMAFE